MEYENVVESFIQTIFQSGMLLNEHDELLTQFWKPIPIERPNYKKICLISVGSLAGCIIALYKRSTFLGTASIIPFGFEVSRIVYNKQRYRQSKQQFSLLVKSLQGIYRLIKNVLSHYHLRKTNINGLSSPVRKVCEDLILDSMLTFLTDVGKIIFELLLFLSNSLKQIKDIIDIGSLNFVFSIDLDPETFQFDKNSEESILNNYDQIYMAFIYVTSTFLCGFGLSLCKNEWKSDNSQFPELFSLLLPEYLRYTSGVYETLKANFGSICNTLNQHPIDEVPKNPEKPIINTISSLREQLRVSFDITIAMQQHLINSNDNSGFENYLDDLEAVFTRSNDILKVFGYNIQKSPTAINETLKPIQDKLEQEDGVPLIKHDDCYGDLKDEEYNLSVHGSMGSDESDFITASYIEYEELLSCVKSQKAMIRELNEELKQRNVVKQDIAPVPSKGTRIQEVGTENSESITPKSVPPCAPPFPMDGNSATTSKCTPNDVPENFKSINDRTEQSACQGNSRKSKADDFLEQIRAAAANRANEEIVFGDDAGSSDGE